MGLLQLNTAMQITTLTAIISISIALIAGFFLGWFVCRRVAHKLMSLSSAEETIRILLALQRIRATDHLGAAELLEQNLDQALLSLGKWPSLDAAGALRMAREYRAGFPRRTTSSEIDNGVPRVLQPAALTT